MPIAMWDLVPGFIMPDNYLWEVRLYPDSDPTNVLSLTAGSRPVLVGLDENGDPWVEFENGSGLAPSIVRLTSAGFGETVNLSWTNNFGFARHSANDKVVFPPSGSLSEDKIHVASGGVVGTYTYGTLVWDPCSCPDPSTCTEDGLGVYVGSLRQVRGQAVALWQKGREVWKIDYSMMGGVLPPNFSKVWDVCVHAPGSDYPDTHLALVDNVAFFVRGFSTPFYTDHFEIWRSTYPYDTWAKVADFPYPYTSYSMSNFTSVVGKLPDGRYYMLANVKNAWPPVYLVPRLFVSNDGITWTDAGPTDLPASDAVCAWTHTGTRAWAIACDSTGCKLYWSTNGLNWTYVADATSSFGNVYGVAASSLDVNPVDVIEDLLNRVELPCPIDATSFADARSWAESNGLKVSVVLESQQSALQAIEQILTHSFLMLVYSQGSLKLIPRRAETVTRELKIDDATEGQSAAFSMGGIRDTRNRVRVDFTDRSHAYNPGQAHATDDLSRQLTGERTENISLPWITDAATAKKIAARYLLELSNPRITIETTLGPKDVALQPGDVVAVTYPEMGLNQQPARILSISETPDGESFRVQMITEPTAMLAIRDHPVETPNPGPPPPAPNEDPGPTGVSFCELPYEISGYRIQLAFSFASASDAWRGCTVYASTDGGVSYSPLATYLGSPMQSGTFTSFPNVGTGYHGQETATLDLTQTRVNTLEGTTRDNALDIENRAMLGREIISFRDAQLVSPGVWLLTGIFRGRYELEPGSDLSFGLLENAFIVTLPNEWEGRTIYFKVAAINRFGVEQDLASVTPFSYTVQGVALRPDPVQGLQAVISGEDGLSRTIVGQGQVDFSIKWRYSHPFVGEDADLVYGNEPVGKETDFLAYVVRVYTKSTQAGTYTLRRTAEVTTEQYTYTAAMNIADAGSYQRFCKFEVSVRRVDMRESWRQTIELVALP